MKYSALRERVVEALESVVSKEGRPDYRRAISRDEVLKVKSSSGFRALRNVLIALGASVVVGGIGIAVIYVADLPIMPDLGDLKPFPEELRVVDSYVSYSANGETADIQLVVDPESLEGRQGIDALNRHIARNGWDEKGTTDWGFRAVREGGPVLYYGRLDDYLEDVRRRTGSLLDQELVAFLEEHRAPGRLIVIAI